MALLTLHRTPSVSTTPDECIPRRGRLQKRESFALVKGAVLLLEENEREGNHEEEEEEEEKTPPEQTEPAEGGARASDTQHRHLHAMLELLRPEDTIQLAVQLESVSPVRVRYLIVVSTLSNKQESILLGMDFPASDSVQCTIGLVLPVWSDTQVYLDGDGGFSVTSAEANRIFKPVAMQTMWSVLQVLHGCCERAVKAAVIPGCGLDWAKHYYQHMESDRFCLNEWEVMRDLQSVRKDSNGNSSPDRLSKEKLIKKHLIDIMSTEDIESLTSRMVKNALQAKLGFDIKPFKEYIDNETMVTLAQMDKPCKIFDYLYLGSEWNAANFEELHKNNVGYILNVTREIDNFFPESFTYMNIRVYDVEATDLLSHWTDTYNFINTARKNGQAVLVHCKMGVSRSASTVIAYAMKQQRWPLDVALAYVKDRRSVARPNEGFMKQLQTYNGILTASQQRHSALWRRKSREQRKMSLQREDGGEEDEDDDDDEEDEGLDSEEEVDGESPDDKDEEEEVFESKSKLQSEQDQDPAVTGPQAGAPSITISEPNKMPASVNRSGRMNLFSLMQSISEQDDDEQLQGARLSPRQPRRGSARRGLIHQRERVDISPEPRSLPDSAKP
ncbi:protein phosphatase Slingshot homolog 3 [Genypterus blacodes]|uniref:protein phosphatase Slingshot homolog 3 n=1 Tax=Genypterus blacodes TaxID=154954 RepID=UPI003F7704F7